MIVLYLYLDNKWKPHALTVAGDSQPGKKLNQLYHPRGISIDDDDQTLYIADYGNHRVTEWKSDQINPRIVAGGNGKGNALNQLCEPTDVVIDKANNSLIIADAGNRRVMRYSRQDPTNGQIIISDIDCYGLALNKNGDFYVSDWKKHEVRQWKRREEDDNLIAGGNGQGDHVNQFNNPAYIFVDENDSLYVSDWLNHRVMKWKKNAKEGIVVAGGNGQGSNLSQLSCPEGIIVDSFDHIYIVDAGNDRIMCWCEGEREGSVVVGGNRRGKLSNQFDRPRGLSFDGNGNLYVADCWNGRIQKFEVNSN